MKPATAAEGMAGQPSQPSQLLLIGASTRAAAQSAQRCGFGTWAIDLFGDEDLRACCTVLQSCDYPRDLAQLARALPLGPWIYTGAMENHPSVIDEISTERRLFGNGADAVARVRDPQQWTAIVREAGLNAPAVTRSAETLPKDGSWLRKPIDSAGGSRIRRWSGEVLDELCTDGRWYFQERIAGPSYAAIYVAAGGQSALLGVTEQLVGAPWGKEFQYCGSIGPLRIDDRVLDQFERLGTALAREFGLTGLFGVDVVLANDVVWPVEINPRYTASVEVLERATSLHAMQLHVDACVSGVVPADAGSARGGHVEGKRIIFASQDIRISERFAQFVHAANDGKRWPVLADIPAVGSEIRCGRPVITAFASGEDRAECAARLHDATAQVQQALQGCYVEVAQ